MLTVSCSLKFFLTLARELVTPAATPLTLMPWYAPSRAVHWTNCLIIAAWIDMTLLIGSGDSPYAEVRIVQELLLFEWSFCFINGNARDRKWTQLLTLIRRIESSSFIEQFPRFFWATVPWHMKIWSILPLKKVFITFLNLGSTRLGCLKSSSSMCSSVIENYCWSLKASLLLTSKV